MNRWNKAQKRIAFATLSVFTLALLYYFPLQRMMAERKLDEYLSRQGVRRSEIESVVYCKDYTQDGYFADVRFTDDPYRYTYHYFLLSRTRRDGVLLDTMTCQVFDANNCGMDHYAEGMKYSPLEWEAGK